MITVCLATYNGAHYISEQLRSVLSQLGPLDEVVVSDDCSTDNTRELIANLVDSRIRILEGGDRLGVVKNFERAFLEARGDMVFLCDQDDVWLPGKCAVISDVFRRNPSVLVIVSDAQLIDASGQVTSESFMATRGGFCGNALCTLMRNRYLGCAMAVRRELLVAALPMPNGVPMHDMWLGALGSLLGGVYYIPTPLLQYRRHNFNVSPARHQGWLRMLLWRFALLVALAGRIFKLVLGRHVSVIMPSLPGGSKS